jgi:hypothetical protein
MKLGGIVCRQLTCTRQQAKLRLLLIASKQPVTDKLALGSYQDVQLLRVIATFFFGRQTYLQI